MKANLRIHEKESFNIVINLIWQYEDYVKVNKGGRLVYFNSVNGPNIFLVVNNPVNVINDKRNDVIIIINIFLGDVDIFNNVLEIFHLI